MTLNSKNDSKNELHIKAKKMKSRGYFILLLSITFLFGCQRESDINVLPLSNLRDIKSFSLKPYQNPGNVMTIHTATIDEANKLITLKLPANLRLDSIRPDIVFAPWATISPQNLEYIDLRKDTVEFTVIAQSGKKAVYAVVKDMTYKYTNTIIYAISFPDILNVAGDPYRIQYWLNTYATTIKVPQGTDITKLKTYLEFAGDSQNTTVTVSENGSSTFRPYTNPVNFTKPVKFRVLSEDGKIRTDYTLTVAFL